MKSYTFYFLFFFATFILNPFHQNNQEKFSLPNLNKAIYSGFLQSQKVPVLEDIILSCKFKSMNRKSTKSPKFKGKVSKI